MNYLFSELISYFGCLLGIIVMAVVWAKMKGNNRVKATLILVILISTAVSFIGTVVYSGKAIYFPHLLRIDSPLHFLIGPSCFFYTYATFKPGFRFRWVQLLNLLPFAIDLIWFIPFYIDTRESKVFLYESSILPTSAMLPFRYSLKMVSLAVYLVLQYIVFFKYKKLLASSNRHLIVWFYIYFGGQTIAMLGMIIAFFWGTGFLSDPYRFSHIMITIFLFSVTIGLLFSPGLLYGISGIRQLQSRKYSQSRLIEEDKNRILEKLTHYLEEGGKPYLNYQLSLPEVAEALKVPPHHLSQAINEKTALNFNNFLNTYRIKEAERLLKSDEYKVLTIDAIAQKCGFHSKSSFYKAFKNATGMTPKEFHQMTSPLG